MSAAHELKDSFIFLMLTVEQHLVMPLYAMQSDIEPDDTLGRQVGNPLSPFISVIPKTLFSVQPPTIMMKELNEVSAIIHREAPKDDIVKAMVEV